MNAAPFRLFISYAHKGEARKNRLLTALTPLRHSGLIGTWTDREIPAGTDWKAEIETEMAAADGAIFLVCENFLASGFCQDAEVAHFLQRHRDGDGKVLIVFVLADDCMWEEYDYLKRFQMVPRDGKPITGYHKHSTAYTAVAREIRDSIRAHQEKHPKLILESRAALPLESRSAVASLDLASLLARLPGRTTHLFGREAELDQISGWKDHKGVFLWIADGGMGKSALVRWWLEQQQWPAGTRFLGHSFYSQGSHNQATTARNFLLDALKQLAVPHADNAADDELGRLLAEAVAKEPTVLVLDGIEPLQQPSTDDKLNGTVKDRGLGVLLEGLARKPGHALCLASSRLPIPDAGIAKAAYFRKEALDILPPPGALALLSQRGVRDEDAELIAMTERCGRHPLALVLAAEFCHTYLQDSAAEFLKRPWQPKPGEKHAATVMAWFDNALNEEHQALDRELARILGLFDRPAPWGALLALKVAAPITGLTQKLHDADEPTILESLARLSQWGLLDADLARREPELDAHPLVREHFGSLLEMEQPQAWQAAHSVLFDWFRNLPDKKQPDTLEELEPLYRAVGHGCKAGRYRTALNEVYLNRIQRGNQGYSLFQLGAYSSNLATLAGFFPQGWGQPPVAVEAGRPGETLSEAGRSWLLSTVAFCLMSLGRLREALGPRRMDLQAQKESANWSEFCRSSEGLIALLTSLGHWVEAEDVGRKAITAAAHIKDKKNLWQRTMATHAYLGRALHGQGRLIEALSAYRQAERTQAEAQPYEPMLYSSRGYAYAQLLLEQASEPKGWQKVLRRGAYAMNITKGNGHLLSQALDYCTIGLASAALSEPAAGEPLNSAVTTMQRAGKIELQPAMHLARAGYKRSLRDRLAAWADHEAAHAIAERGNMRTYLAECALLAGNLCLDEGRVGEAAAQHAEVARLIREDGYGRRLAELHLLHARLLHAQHDPAAAQALADAEARIREIGQWYFWRELRAVAKEIGAADPGECPDIGPRKKQNGAKKKPRKNSAKRR
ncbi:MAG: toll/interleukin-1 receptor domain-containing protein [Rhodocyclaceae bacterium]|nr:toll/interleukin-1 receptor domain-containing protein [Rhodocyclaceae bacterium]